MPRPDKKRKRKSVYQVLEMFGSLGLPVCDDEEAIKTARDEQRGTRNRELNSTKGSVAARAQQWFDDVNILLNKRQGLLDIVFEEFCNLCDTVLRADIDGGRSTLGADTQLACRDIAMSWCRTRSDLANRWINDYLELRGLQGGGELEQAPRVTEFKAVARKGRVMLTWTPPDGAYEEVRLLRSADPATEDDVETLVYQGRDASFLDTSVSPKAHYVYRAYTYQDGRRSLSAVVASTRRPKQAPKKLKPGLAAAVLLALATGLVAIDRFFGENIVMGGLTASLEAATASAGGAAVTPPAQDGAVVDGQPVEGAAADPADAPVDDEVVVVTTPPADGSPPRAWMTSPPRLAFAGKTLKIDLAFSEPLEPELVEAQLVGVAVRRLEFEVDPPSVRLEVQPLDEGAWEGEASWSFRLKTADGRLTEVIEGSCTVVPAD